MSRFGSAKGEKGGISGANLVVLGSGFLGLKPGILGAEKVELGPLGKRKNFGVKGGDFGAPKWTF